jgi:proteasome lid subunit RPN8/RPN11
MVRIKREALEFALHAARNTYPDEFIALLREDAEGVVTHVLLLPRSTYGRGFSSIDFNMVPMFSHSCGSFHSHPVPSNRPSRGDLLFFSRFGKVHLIAGYPYEGGSVRAYGNEGQEVPLEVVE